MARRHLSSRARAAAPTAEQPPSLGPVLAPLGALAAGFGLAGLACAQTPPGPTPPALPQVTVRGTPETADKQSLRASRTGVAKGDQALRDVPQSVTVHTERLMDDRHLDDLREVLRATAGVTFQAGETGEEDVRLRGFSLLQAGDLYVDGLRDAPLYERDTFNNDRIEVLKGSASMLFGRGSTGGVVNQVSKKPFLMNQHEVEATVGTGRMGRVTGDFNLKTGEDAALRLNAMVHHADNDGATVDKRGIAPTYRWGIGTRNEFLVGLYHLEYDNRPLYDHPWLLSQGNRGTLIPTLEADAYYGLASDHNEGGATYGTLQHVHRFDGRGELKTTLRHGKYERDLWASVVRFAPAAQQPDGQAITRREQIRGDTVLSRTGKGRVGQSEITTLQSEYSDQLDWGGVRHEVLAGIEWSREDAKRNNNIPGATPRPTTRVGTPDDGAAIPDTRWPIAMAKFDTKNLSLYAQDVVSLTPLWKLVGGVRFDRFRADYRDTAGATKSIAENLWSPRLGVLYQPNDSSSYYASYGYSYNTSGETYSYSVNSSLASPGNQRALNTPPEKSRNVEIGGKFDLLDHRLFVGAALFYSEKYNERNTDPDSAATQELLSGKRHAAGLELNVAGRITPAWEAFVSYSWIPRSKIDRSNVALNAAGTGAQVEGDRPGLTPKHSGSVWMTYRLTPQLRVGTGVNFRSAQNPEGARHVRAPGFATVDLMGEYLLSEVWSFKLNVKNAGDKRHADGLYRGFYIPGAPRTVQLSAKAVF